MRLPGLPPSIAWRKEDHAEGEDDSDQCCRIHQSRLLAC